MSDTAIVAEIGQRIRRYRLNGNLTQADLAERAGISLRTLQNAEGGQVTTIETLIAILRELGLLAQLEFFLPEPPLSPVQLARLQGQVRQRASGRREKEEPPPSNWRWGE